MRAAMGLAAALLVAPPGAIAQPAAATASTADRAFAELADRWLAETLRLNPIAATQAGDYRYNALLPDIGARGRGEQLALSKATLDALRRIDRASLSRAGQVDHALLENQLKFDIFQLEELEEHAWNPLGYTAVAGSALYGLMAREFAPLPERLRAATRRMEALPALLAEARRQLVPARVPKIYAETAVRQNAGLASIVDDMILSQAKLLPTDEQARLTRAAAGLKAAADVHGKWLEAAVVPAAKGDFRLGQKLYDRKLALALNSPLSRAEIRQRAETVIAATRTEMYGISRAVLAGRTGAPPTPDIPTPEQQQAAIAAALDLAAAEQPPRDQVVPFARKAMAQATAFVREKGLVKIPDGADWQIIDLPEFQQGVAVAYADTPGPLDRNQRAFYAVSPIPKDWTDAQTTSFLREYNTRAIQELTIHEAMPGHLLQGAHSNRYPSTLRAYLGSGTMVEGWGMYAEDVMREAGYLDSDPLYQLVHLKWRLRATMNAIIDQMAHVDGASREAVMELLTKTAFQEEREAAGKWTRLQLSSAQLPTYFVGYSEWRDLRRAAEARPGFSQRDFHDRALSFGSPPVRFIRQLLFDEPIR
ncbi:DUF885 domain-containing protein [Sphingomonas sp.]|uniref:DUF885 domain-containing protein n=1 Tax=Sphingomonas sp. TaxID=28214 RepID=UPI00286E4E85|nr:DUF885 domain-containing protein [Sphingomonas sp.]